MVRSIQVKSEVTMTTAFAGVVLWHAFNQGQTLGQKGSEDGIILRDEEHTDLARVTLERDGTTAPFAITCGVYGWLVHTIFLRDQTIGQETFEKVKVELEKIIALIPTEGEATNEKYRNLSSAISDFVHRY